MADENGDIKQTKLEDSNMANYGSKAHVDARKAAAETEKEFKGAGVKVGLEIWRVENKRTAADTPDFGVKRWPVENYGEFYTGDSYIALNTYRAKDPLTGKDTDKLAWDVHFWLGNESSQDEIGVAAYKTVELDDLLDDGPVQHREIQGHESPLFQSYFKEIRYMEGGIASGFRNVKPEEYVPRMFQIKRTKKTVRAWPVPVKANSLDDGDVFVLDTGLIVYLFVGKQANAFEKMKGGAIAHNIVGGRNGKAKKKDDIDDNFWKVLGGSEKDIKPASEDKDEPEADMDVTKNVLFHLSDSSGSMKFTKVATGDLKKDMLISDDVMILDSNISIFVWIGKGASKAEKSNAMKYADDYLKSQKKPATIPVTALSEGQIDFSFDACFKR